jgi:hypothetical protein
MSSGLTCRCHSEHELRGQEALDYIDHLEYVTEVEEGWQFRCPDTQVEWVMPYLPKDTPTHLLAMRRTAP